MAQERPEPIAIADLRGGRNDTDPPMSLPVNQCTEALNIDWKDSTVARKRGGASLLAYVVENGLYFLKRHLPSTDALAELWTTDGNLMNRLAGVTWSNVTLDDAMHNTAPVIMDAVSMNGKLYFAYPDSTQLVDRLHVYDPSLAVPRIRRVSFATPGAPTAANNGSGALPAEARFYRVRWLQLDGTRIVRRSNAGPSVSFTPSGTGSTVRVTQPTPPGEGETHWEMEVSTDDAVWYVYYGSVTGAPVGAIAIASTTADDGVNVAYYAANFPASGVAGLHGIFPSVRFLMTDGNRLLGGGAYVATGANSEGKQSRIWHTPVLGSADAGDDERIENTQTRKGWTDLNEKDGGGFTGCGGPLNGQPWWFKYRQVWKLLPTSDASTPYLPRKVRDDIGCPWHRTITIGEDQFGRPALYFLSHRGPYRITFDGDIQYLGRDNEATWRKLYFASTIQPHAVFYPDLHQWWVFITTTDNAPNFQIKMMLDVQHAYPDEHGHVRGGWSKHTGLTGAAVSSCLFSNTPGVAMSGDLKPHVGTVLGKVLKCDTTATDDDGTDFQAYVTTRPMLATKDLLNKVSMDEPTLIAKAQSGADVSITIVRDFGKESRTIPVNLTPEGSETRVIKNLDALEMGEADVLQLTIGDAVANDEVWSVDAVIVPMKAGERRG